MTNIIKEFKNNLILSPDKIALYYGDNTTLSYKDLDAKSDYLASYLSLNGIKKNDIVPILFKPSIEMIISIFAILKVGAAYLPINPKEPFSRIQFLIEDSNASILLKSSDITLSNNISILTKDISANKLKSFDTDFKYTIGDYPYVIYTSGSTGTPKGVKVTHDNLMYLLNNLQKYYPIDKNDKYLLGTPYVFDVSVSEIFGWILGNASLVISSLETKESFTNISDLIDSYNITHIALSPAVMNLILNILTNKELEIFNKTLKHIMIAGDTFPYHLGIELLNKLPNVLISNLYGPTEATVYCSRYDITDEIKKLDYIPIGESFDNSYIKLLNSNGDEVPIGTEGEICIYGKGISSGYHNNTILTNDKFINDLDGTPGYKTGDLGIITQSNGIKYIGRRDFQVQINGIRVELGEIENAINNIDGITTSTLVYSNNKLTAFYVSDSILSSNNIKKQLEDKLPKYMIPNIYIKLDSLPLNQNGKIDRKKLLDFTTLTDLDDDQFNSIELQIKSIFNDLLNTSVTNKNIGFFDLGGDSLSAILACIKLENIFGIKLTENILYLYPTIEKLGSYISSLLTKQTSIKKSPQKELTASTYNTLKDIVIKNIDKNTTNLKDLSLTYKTFYHQNIYVTENFNSLLNIEIEIPKTFTIESIVNAINILIETNSMFRSKLNYKDNILQFFEYSSTNQLNIPIIDLSGYSIDIISKLKQYIYDLTNTKLSETKLNTILHNILIINSDCDQYTLLFLMDHNICDLGSKHSIRKKLLNILNNSLENNERPFEDYINLVSKKNSDDLLCNPYSLSIKSSHTKVNRCNLDILPNEPFIVKRKLGAILSNDELISKSVYLTGQIGCEIFECDTLAINTIMNGRNIKALNMTNFIGNLPITTTILCNKNETFIDFKQRSSYDINLFYKENLHVPLYYAYKDYPTMNNTQKNIQYIFDSGVIMNVNYMGTLKNEELLQFFNDIQNTHKELSKFPIKQLRVSAVSDENYLYLCFMRHPILNNNFLNNYNLEIVDFLTK